MAAGGAGRRWRWVAPRVLGAGGGRRRGREERRLERKWGLDLEKGSSRG